MKTIMTPELLMAVRALTRDTVRELPNAGFITQAIAGIRITGVGKSDHEAIAIPNSTPVVLLESLAGVDEIEVPPLITLSDGGGQILWTAACFWFDEMRRRIGATHEQGLPVAA